MSIDEAGINENNKKILLRLLMPNLLGSSIGCKDNNLKSEKIDMYVFVKPEKIEKISIYGEKHIQNNFPYDSQKNEQIPRNQESYFKHKKYVEFTDEFSLKNENKSFKNNIPINITHSPSLSNNKFNNDIYNS